MSDSPSSHSLPPPASGMASDELGSVVDRLLDVMFAAAASLGLFVVIGSLNRWVQKGWHPQHLVHLGVYLALLSGYLVSRRASRHVRVAILIVPLWANGAANIVLQGVGGTGTLFLSTACVLAVVLFGLRAAIVTLVASTVVIVAMGVVCSLDLIPWLVEARLGSPSEWVAEGTSFVGLVAGFIAILNVVHNALRQRTMALEREIAERKRIEAQRLELENQLQQAEKLKVIGQLAGGIAHDFNNQLAGIMGYAELLQSERRDDPLVQEYTNAILAPGRRAADLTGKLLAFARRGQYRREPVDLHAVVREVLSLLSRSIDKNITVVERLDAPQSTVLGDPTLLQSAVLNVALNARDAMPGGGTLTFTTECAATSLLVLRITDTGQGMDAETLRHVFEPFFTTKAVGRGTGMGLPAAQGTIQRHGGSVDIESAPGRGTTVVVSLPLAGPEHIPASPSGRVVIVEGKGHILLIDDEATVREMTAQFLRTLGYSVTSVSDAAEALRRYRAESQTIDLVLLDMVLPGTRGVDVFRALRQHNPEAKILILSGYSADDDARALLSQGALGFIQKPAALSDLSERIAKAIVSRTAATDRSD